ncbi:3D domain-containing protein [Brevibacillus laterosporus]|uniref:3D domain-containing protein n=2 Tax=Brevibacillus TaxID=55080 RepID=A0A0F6XYX9_BRELA|nr:MULTISPECIES: 3D domain-containing protein [Brevibacillus]AKF92806.1 hypothetical protein EX87_03385 [Brevibacillus laterosporus]MCR8987089.1 3D domain-containing protein [Brevibacillus laterosporus]MCZ0832826.1 3D domain-containing protein [Brevibacillus halotolerans]GIO02117.1 hypothetical protein J5TS2_27850 [Brevibacillus halotolerans]
MKWVRFVSLLTISMAFLLGLTSYGYSSTIIDAGGTTSSLGLHEKKEGYKMIKKRYVLSSSMTETNMDTEKNDQSQNRKLGNRINKSDETAILNQYPKVRVVATGYYAGVESTGKSPGHPSYGITYSGIKVHRGTYSTIAADLQVFPLGTVLYVPGYGYGVVADKGGAIRGKKLDLYFNTKNDVYSQWGKREVEVFVIHRGKGFVNEEMMKALNKDGVEAFARITN